MSDLIFDVVFDFFAVFNIYTCICIYTWYIITRYIYCSTVLNHAAERPQKNRPFPRGRKLFLLAVLGVRQEVPSRFEGIHIVFYHPFQRPRPLPHPHTGMFHTKIVIAQLSECLVVNLEEALPHPFYRRLLERSTSGVASIRALTFSHNFVGYSGPTP